MQLSKIINGKYYGCEFITTEQVKAKRKQESYKKDRILLRIYKVKNSYLVYTCYK